MVLSFGLFGLAKAVSIIGQRQQHILSAEARQAVPLGRRFGACHRQCRLPERWTLRPSSLVIRSPLLARIVLFWPLLDVWTNTPFQAEVRRSMSST